MSESEYKSMHRRLDALRLPVKYRACAWCFLTADQWAYRWNDPAERREGNRVWSENTRNYVALCRSCHKLMDNTHRRVGREGLEDAIAPLVAAAYAAVSPERRAIEAEAREASAKAAHAYLDSQDRGLDRRYGRQPVSAERATTASLSNAFGKGEA